MIKKTIFALALLVVTSLPSGAQAQTNEAEYRAYLLALIELLQQQIVLLQAEQSDQVSAGAVIFGDPDEFTSFLLDGYGDVSSWYLLSDPAAVRDIRNSTHRQYFSKFFDIVPDAYDDYFVDLLVFKEKSNDFDGFVETVEPYESDTWRLGISDGIFDFGLTSSVVEELFVHEFAHIISYEEILGRPAPSNTRCHEYFADFGCPPANSYLLDFMDEFWSEDELDEFVDTGSSDSIWSQREVREDFVSDYASTDPAEDFAESFAFFVLDGLPNVDSLADEKIQYFYDFPKMMKVREEIRKEL